MIFIPCQCPLAHHAKKQRRVRGGTNCLWFDPLSPDGCLYIHFIYSSVCPSGVELPAGGRKREMVEFKDKEEIHRLTLDSGCYF